MTESPQSVGYELNEQDVVALCEVTQLHGASVPGRSIVPLGPLVTLGAIVCVPISIIVHLAVGIVILLASVVVIVSLAESTMNRTGAKRRANALLAAGYGRLTQRRYDITIDADWFASRTDWWSYARAGSVSSRSSCIRADHTCLCLPIRIQRLSFQAALLILANRSRGLWSS